LIIYHVHTARIQNIIQATLIANYLYLNAKSNIIGKYYSANNIVDQASPITIFEVPNKES